MYLALMDDQDLLFFVDKGTLLNIYFLEETWIDGGGDVSKLETIQKGYNDLKLFDVYDLKGKRVKTKATSIDNLPKGIYVIEGNKIIKQ